ncbi:MAG: hypothetical protein RPU39_00310 [Candidatus Sedimenticola sp. (ex Thyasira tokunagai)]
MPGIIEFMLNGGVGLVGFFGGRYYEKTDQRGQLINDKVSKLSNDISELSVTATDFYIKEMDERNTAAKTALIGGALKRINNDLDCLCRMAETESTRYLDVVTDFHKAITAEPFGEPVIQPLDAHNSRITSIQNAEQAFIRKLRSLERI